MVEDDVSICPHDSTSSTTSAHVFTRKSGSVTKEIDEQILNNGSSVEYTIEQLDTAIRENFPTPPPKLYKEWKALVTNHIGRLLTLRELKYIGCLYNRHYYDTQADPSIVSLLPLTDDNSSRRKNVNIKIIMGYSTDYHVGYLCERINRSYATDNNYQFESYVLTYQDIMEKIQPRSHCTWLKVKLFIDLLNSYDYDTVDDDNKVNYIMWMDADSIYVNHHKKLEEIIHSAHYKDIIIAEDMHTGCLINAGVILFKCSKWSRYLWQQVWEVKRYFYTPFYEQAALTHILKVFGEGLEYVTPFHSFVRKSTSSLYFYHLAVLSCYDFNRNECYYTRQVTNDDIEPYVTADASASDDINRYNQEYEARMFIFHPAGKKNKLDLFLKVTKGYNICVPSEDVLVTLNSSNASMCNRPNKWYNPDNSNCSTTTTTTTITTTQTVDDD